jgi:hypothetical protein
VQQAIPEVEAERVEADFRAILRELMIRELVVSA